MAEAIGDCFRIVYGIVWIDGGFFLVRRWKGAIGRTPKTIDVLSQLGRQNATLCQSQTG